jgi:putative phosphoribosyl transferase
VGAPVRAKLSKDACVRSGQYADRRDAGRVLAADERLARYAGEDVVVLGLPRGGVPVAAPVANALQAPLDVVLVRKLGTPGHDELAMGAIASIGGSIEVVRNEPVVARVSNSDFVEVYRRELLELREREVRYRGGRPPVVVRGRVAILVDDGLATGSTMRAAIAAVRTQQPERVVVAVPVGAEAACRELATQADDVVCAWVPQAFLAVGQAYLDFGQTTDDEVRAALATSSP